MVPCPCGSNKQYLDCCGCYLEKNEIAPTAETLMRSRYTAYTLGREDYLLASWCNKTRPIALDLLSRPSIKWLGLDVKRHEHIAPNHAIVEFIARYKVAGRAHRLHEISRFVHQGGLWFYVDGDII